MLVTNAKAFTGRDEDDFQYAFQIVDGSIAWVGAAGDAPDDPDVLDLRGATVLPGLLDVHTHPALLSQLIGVTSVLPPSVTSIEGLIATMRTHPGLGKGPGVWIRGFGFDDAKYPEGRWPDRHDLDRVSTTQPVFIQRCDAHSAVVNTFLLRLAGISSATPDPIGAQIGRDAGGEPDGRLVEPGSWLPVLDLMPTDDDQSRIAKLAELGDHFADHGIVGVGDMAATFIAEPLASFRVAAQRSWLPRIGLYPFWADIKDDPGELTDADRSGPVFLAGVKLLMDGAYSNATAWCHDPIRAAPTGSGSGRRPRKTSSPPASGPGGTASSWPATPWATPRSTRSWTPSRTRRAGSATFRPSASSTAPCSPPSGSSASRTPGCGSR